MDKHTSKHALIHACIHHQAQALPPDSRKELLAALNKAASHGEVPRQAMNDWVADMEAATKQAETLEVVAPAPWYTRLLSRRGRTAVLSGILLGVMGISFNCVMATLVFGGREALQEFVPIGVIMYHFSAIIAGPAITALSGCRSGVGSGNIKHATLFAPIVLAITDDMERGGGPINTPQRRSELISTVLFAMGFSTLLFSLVWTALGQFRLTRVMQFMPAFVTSGFVASVGYLIVLKALLVGSGDKVTFEVQSFTLSAMDKERFWYLVVPGVATGALMFTAKRYEPRHTHAHTHN